MRQVLYALERHRLNQQQAQLGLPPDSFWKLELEKVKPWKLTPVSQEVSQNDSNRRTECVFHPAFKHALKVSPIPHRGPAPRASQVFWGILVVTLNSKVVLLSTLWSYNHTTQRILRCCWWWCFCICIFHGDLEGKTTDLLLVFKHCEGSHKIGFGKVQNLATEASPPPRVTWLLLYRRLPLAMGTHFANYSLGCCTHFLLSLFPKESYDLDLLSLHCFSKSLVSNEKSTTQFRIRFYISWGTDISRYIPATGDQHGTQLTLFWPQWPLQHHPNWIFFLGKSKWETESCTLRNLEILLSKRQAETKET